MKKRYALLLVFIFLSATVFGQEIAVQKDIAEAEQLVESYYLYNEIPGMSVSVYREGEIIWSRGFGYSNLSKKTPINPGETLFRIGSVSKTYTAAAVGLLVQRGKLDVNKSIHAYVPTFPQKKYDFTVKQLGGHIAGIRTYRGDEFLSNVSYPSVTAALEIFEDDTLLFKPGTQYSYSSYGWNLMSAVVEGASGESFIPFMETEVFQPLNMTHTMPDYTHRDIPGRTKFYVYKDGENEEAPQVDLSNKWAGGGFLSTTEDMIAFGKAHLSTDFLNQSTLHLLMTPQHTSDGKSTNYGIGWATITDAQGNLWKGHSGGSVGGTTMFMLNAEHQVIIAFAINRSSAPISELRNKLAEIFIE
jgi:CubicO group peptidase (beta-lactamase class C family)